MEELPNAGLTQVSRKLDLCIVIVQMPNGQQRKMREIGSEEGELRHGRGKAAVGHKLVEPIQGFAKKRTQGEET